MGLKVLGPDVTNRARFHAGEENDQGSRFLANGKAKGSAALDNGHSSSVVASPGGVEVIRFDWRASKASANLPRRKSLPSAKPMDRSSTSRVSSPG